MFTDLILLIGTNPLPNYVAAKYFLKVNQDLNRIWLVCSLRGEKQASTIPYGKSLELLLKSMHPKLNIGYINISDVTNASNIRAAIKNKNNEFEGKNIHLHYTGGTKAMVANIYYVLTAEFINIPPIECSYLSAKDFKIYQDMVGTITGNLLSEIAIPLKDLLKIHDFINKEPIILFKNNIIGQAVINYFDQNKILDILNETNELLNYLRNRNSQLKKLSNINPNWENYRPGKFAKLIDENTDEKNRVFNANGTKNNFQNDHYVEEYAKFFEGGWLELLIYFLLEKEYSKDINISVNSNVVVRKAEWRDNNFEIDVLVIKGYQLIGISITTSSNKHLIKNKGFEIIHRSRQMGGDEAKSILISFAGEDVVQAIHDELVSDTGNAKENLLVLGIESFNKKKYIERIVKFIGE